MKKPKPHKYYDYHEVIHYLEQKYNFDERDYYFYWKKKKEDNQIALQKIKEVFGNTSFWEIPPLKYTEEEKQQSKLFNEIKSCLSKDLPEDLDFWGEYLVDRHDISNNSRITLYEQFSDIKEYCNEYQNILKWLFEEFGEGEIGNRAIDFVVSW